jgi:hypothetical protein
MLNYSIFVFFFLLSVCLGRPDDEGQKPISAGTSSERLAEADSHDASGHIAIVTKDLEDFIQEKMKKWHAPGLAIAIIEGDKSWYKVRSSSNRQLLS